MEYSFVWYSMPCHDHAPNAVDSLSLGMWNGWHPASLIMEMRYG
jgi:hypothetical protein